MEVHIKKFGVNMQVRSSGIEFEIHPPKGGDQIGDCYLTMTGLFWCKGRTGKNRGINVSWEKFITIMSSKESLKAAVTAVKKVSG